MKLLDSVLWSTDVLLTTTSKLSCSAPRTSLTKRPTCLMLLRNAPCILRWKQMLNYWFLGPQALRSKPTLCVSTSKYTCIFRCLKTVQNQALKQLKMKDLNLHSWKANIQSWAKWVCAPTVWHRLWLLPRKTAGQHTLKQLLSMQQNWSKLKKAKCPGPEQCLNCQCYQLYMETQS